MEDAKPQMDPGVARRASPRIEVPSQMMATSGGGGVAVSVSEAPSPPAMSIASGQAMPTLPLTAGDAVAGVSAWQNNKKLTALWSNNASRNSWVGVDGIGWKKLVNTNDSSNVALTMLCTHAREKNSVVNYRDESDGMIYEIYVW